MRRPFETTPDVPDLKRYRERKTQPSNLEAGKDARGERLILLENMFQQYLAQSEVKSKEEVREYFTEARGKQLRAFLESTDMKVSLYEYLDSHSDEDIRLMTDMDELMVFYKKYFHLTEQ